MTVKYRVVFTSVQSRMALEEGQQFATDEFEVTFRDGCYNLALALTTGVDDFTYLVESGAT